MADYVQIIDKKEIEKLKEIKDLLNKIEESIVRLKELGLNFSNV